MPGLDQYNHSLISLPGNVPPDAPAATSLLKASSLQVADLLRLEDGHVDLLSGQRSAHQVFHVSDELLVRLV
jgi:hypothetical protein